MRSSGSTVSSALATRSSRTRNNYQREGLQRRYRAGLWDIDPGEQILKVEYDGRKVDYDYADLDELNLAYCVSIHKSQGSEYPAVVIALHTQHYVNVAA